ncbi:MAG: HAD family hydrolase [Hyphomicrobium sp.]
MPQPDITCLLFDKDGTILDFYKTWTPINRDMASEAAGGDAELTRRLLRDGGHDPDTDVIAPGSELAGASMDGIVECFARSLGKRAPPNLKSIIERNFAEGGAKYASLINGAVESIERLGRQGFRLGLATNDTLEGLRGSLARCGDILPLFEFHAGCDSGFGAKPDPGMGLAFAKAMAVDPAACAMIGDNLHDLEMAQRAGFGLRIGVLTGPSARGDLEPHADIVVESICDLPELFIRRSKDTAD